MEETAFASQTAQPTSIAAAESIRPIVVNLATKVLNYIKATGEFGCTCDEAELALSMTHQTCSARFNQLVNEGLIMRTKTKRQTRSGRDALVYISVQTMLGHVVERLPKSA